MQGIISRGGSAARLIQKWIREPNRVLVSILIGNNCANIAASSLLTIWADKRYPGHLTWIVVIFTVSVIIFSEITPKLIARQFGPLLAPYAMLFLSVFLIVLGPAVWIIQKLSEGITFLSGMTGRDLRAPISEEELTHTIELATKEGGIDRETGAVLSNLIDFPDRIARDVMTPRNKVQAISIRWGQDEVLKFVAGDGHSRYPVIRNSLDEVVGSVLVKDLLAHLQRSSAGSWTRAVRRPYFISELAPLGSVLRDMKRWGTHMALVRNETGVITGLLTLEDLIEEIVGEIRDEHDDPADAGSDRAMGGPKIATGEMPLIDFNDRFNVSIPLDANYSTLNGYLLSRMGGVLPVAGTLVIDEDITFRIHSVSDSGIASVEIIDHASGASE
jgi:putative hemolysin